MPFGPSSWEGHKRVNLQERFQSGTLGLTQFGFEDLTGGGDLDYDDIVYNIEPPLDPVGGCIEDLFEPDDTILESATAIQVGESQEHTLCPDGDEDWLRVDASNQVEPKGNLLVETYNLRPDDVTPHADTEIVVFNSILDPIARNTDRGLGPSPGANRLLKSSRTNWHPAGDELFVLQVKLQSPVRGPGDTGYSLRLLDWLTMVVPVDQASWGPTIVSVPIVSRAGSLLYAAQFFSFDQSELDALKDLDATLAWEFRRPEPNEGGTGEEPGSNVDIMDYWQNVDGACVGWYRTNLPNHTDKFSEEQNAISSCSADKTGAINDEEFEIYVDDPSALVAGELYWILVEFHVHNENLTSDYQFYITKVEYCELFLGMDHWCNAGTFLAGKGIANLSEGYLQPAP